MSTGLSLKEVVGTVLLNGWSQKADYSGQRVWSETGEAVSVGVVGKEGCRLFSWARPEQSLERSWGGEVADKKQEGMIE